MHRTRALPFVLGVMLVLVSRTPVWAQRTTATFAGIVTDNSGGVLPGADVELTNENTGVTERQVTSATGEFIFNYVPGGSYTLTISISGFKSYKGTGISVGAAQNIRRKFELEVGELAENVTVTGESPLVNSVSPEQRISLEPLEVKTLPAANRNLTNLLNLGAGLTRQEGVVEGGGTGSGGAGGIRLRLNGLGGAAMTITANGTDASANAGSRQISHYNGISKIDIVSIESVGEVQIVKGVMPAEYGHALAGNLNIITKSGTNDWSGSLFHRYEGKAMVARPTFLKTKPDSVWNQGGGSFGGPLARDRAFFFGAFEGYRMTRSVPLNVNVPSQRFRDLLLTALPFPETRVLLDHYQLPTEPVSATALTGVFIGAGQKENNDDHVDARMDFRVKGGNLSTTFTYGHPFLAQESQLPGQPRVWNSLTRRMTASYAIARGRWSSETRFGYNYNWLSRTDPFYNIVDPAKQTGDSARRQIPTISFPGLVSLGSEFHVRGHIPSYSFEQQATLVTNRHTFKFGGIYATPRGGRYNTSGPNFSFQTLDEVLANRPSAVSFTLRLVDCLWTTTNFGFFAQDDWRVNSKLVVNLGVRYDYFGRLIINPNDPDNPAGIVNLDGLPDPSFTFGPPRSPDRIYEDDAGLNLAPRIGFAYNPDGQGKTVVNGGWGMMFQPFDVQNFEAPIGMTSGVPRSRSFSAREVADLALRYPIYNEDMARRYAAIFTDSPLSPVGVLIDPNLQAPYATVFTLGAQRALGSATVMEAAYVGTRGHKFRQTRTYNEPDRVTGIRPNLNLSQGGYIDNSQETKYDALQTSVRQRLTRSLTFNLNYTWSKTLANFDGDNPLASVNDTGQTVQEFFDIDSNWGPVSGDVTHAFIGSVIYQVPEDWFSSSVPRHLIGGWQLAGIFRATTGQPLVITQSSTKAASRPDVVDFANAINEGCCNPNNLQYLNRAAFQAVPLSPVSRQTIRAGNVGNGAFRGPKYRNLDVSLAKSVPIGGRKKVEFRIDILNALNWTRYTVIQTNLNAGNFGQAVGADAARVAQVQARFSF